MSLDKEWFQVVDASSGHVLDVGAPNDFTNLETAREAAAQEAAARLDPVTVVRLARTEMCTFSRVVTVQETAPTP